MVEVVQLEPDKFFVTVTRGEALELIATLAGQITNNNMNTNRVEFGKRTEKDAAYFTIAVKEEPSDNSCYKVFDRWSVALEQLWRAKTTDELKRMGRWRCHSRREKEIYDRILKDRESNEET